MNVSDAQIARTKRQEGYGRKLPDGGCTAYRELINGKLDIATIGYGCTRNVALGTVWTEAEAEAALRRELAIHEARVDRLVTVAINQNQFDALVDFDFNTGGLTLDNGKPSGVLRAVNAGDSAKVCAELALWNKFGGRPAKALTARRAENAAVYMRPADPVEPSYMPQAAEPASAPLTSGQVAAGAAATGSLIPAVPSMLTANADAATAWQGIGDQMLSLGKWAIASPMALAVIAVTGAGFWLMHRMGKAA